MQFHILRGAPPRHAGEMEVPFPQIPGGGEHCIATGAMSKMQQAQVPVQVGSSARIHQSDGGSEEEGWGTPTEDALQVCRSEIETG